MTKNWIGGMHLQKGALHNTLHVPQDKRIPTGVLAKATHSSNLLTRKRAQLAETFRSFNR